MPSQNGRLPAAFVVPLAAIYAKNDGNLLDVRPFAKVRSACTTAGAVIVSVFVAFFFYSGIKVGLLVRGDIARPSR
jgi:hypothetical protein